MKSNNFKTTRRSQIGILLILGTLLVVGVVGWGLWAVEYTASGSSHREFTLNVDFVKFRQIMVRKNATQAIVAHSGMKLIEERVNDLSVEVPRQKRPILKALLGNANADLAASKQITVSLEDPQLNAKQLTLNQLVDIHPDYMEVHSESSEPAGNLKYYATRLRASDYEGGTKVELTIDQKVDVKVPKLFIAEADRKVQQAADESTTQQEQAIRAFITQFQDEVIVIPELR